MHGFDRFNRTKESIDLFAAPNLEDQQILGMNDFVAQLHNQTNEDFNFEASIQQEFSSAF